MIHGPFIIRNLEAEPEQAEFQGVSYPVFPPYSGEHYTAEAAFYALHEAVLSPYRVTPSTPLQHVMSGDDPADPVMTVPLRFPDVETAGKVIESVLPPVEPV